jgi:hypothetical protein
MIQDGDRHGRKGGQLLRPGSELLRLTENDLALVYQVDPHQAPVNIHHNAALHVLLK